MRYGGGTWLVAQLSAVTRSNWTWHEVSRARTSPSGPWCRCWWAGCTSPSAQTPWGPGSCRRSALQEPAPPGRTSAPVAEKRKWRLYPLQSLTVVPDVGDPLTRFSLTMPSLAAKKAKMCETKCFSWCFKLSQCAKSLVKSTCGIKHMTRMSCSCYYWNI